MRLTVVCNKSFGGFSVSEKFFAKYPQHLSDANIRYNQDLIREIEANEDAYNGRHAKLYLSYLEWDDSKIPIEFILKNVVIHEYDGMEIPGLKQNSIVCDMILAKMFKNLDESEEMIKYVRGLYFVPLRTEHQ